MANILTQEDENQKDQQSQEQGGLTQSTGLMGTSAPGSNAPAPQVQNRPQGSGRFTNLQKYLDANTGAGQQLAGGIRKKGEEYLGKVKEGIESTKNVQQGIQSEQQRLGQAQQYAQQIQDDPMALAQNNLADVTKLRTGQNLLPQLQAGAQQASNVLQQNIQPLQQFGQDLGSESGRFSLLQKTFGGSYRPQYNLGQRRLDQLFLQGSPSNELNQLNQQLGQMTQEGTQATQNLQDLLTTGVQNVREGTQQAQRQIGEALGAFGEEGGGALGGLFGQLGEAQTQRNTYLDDILEQARTQLSSGALSQNVADMLGLSPGLGIADLNLADYAERIGRGDTNVTMADVATGADVNRLNALAQLAGLQEGEYSLGEKYGSDLAFDTDAFTQAAQERQQTFDARDSFWDKQMSDVLGRDVGEGTAEDYINSIMTPSTSGSLNLANLSNAPLAEDVTSGEQIENLINFIQSDLHSDNPYQSTVPTLQTLLDQYNLLKNRQLNIIPDQNNEMANLETGQQFNVT